MKYIVAVLVGAFLVGGFLTVLGQVWFGSDVGRFVARFVAGPVGLLVAFVAFLA